MSCFHMTPWFKRACAITLSKSMEEKSFFKKNMVGDRQGTESLGDATPRNRCSDREGLPDDIN